MTDAQKAAERLAAETPRDQVRTHQWTPVSTPLGRPRTPQEKQHLIRTLRELEARGYSRRDIKTSLGVNNETIIRYLGRKRKPKRTWLTGARRK